MKFINPIHEDDKWYINEINDFFPVGTAENIKSYMQALYHYKSNLKGKKKIFFDSQVTSLIINFSHDKKVSKGEFFRFLDYFVYFINNLTLENLLSLMSASAQRSRWRASFVHYYSNYVLNKKKAWSKRDVVNEVFIESDLTPTQWNLNENRNMGRY